jgi:hypothetical protein
MEFRFNAEEWDKLTPQERIRRCRVLAREAETLANSSSSRMKALYLQLAIQWKLLAEEMGNELSRRR